jgi:hypothetical protein
MSWLPNRAGQAEPAGWHEWQGFSRTSACWGYVTVNRFSSVEPKDDPGEKAKSGGETGDGKHPFAHAAGLRVVGETGC